MASTGAPRQKEDEASLDEPEAGLGEPQELELPDPTIEKRLVWKFDLIILPLLAIIYFTHSLDRANLGNAKTDNFEADIGLTDNQYSLILILFYIPYGTLNIPATVLAKRFSPAIVVPLLMLSWGAVSLGAAAVHDFGGIITARILLGVVEAGFFPSAIYYLTMFYTQYEIAKRISLFYTMGFVANAFSGLIAYSVFQWKTSLHNWQYLFIIEGTLTIFLAMVCLALLPRNLAVSKYFSEEEKKCGALRLQLRTEDEVSKFSWSATVRPLLHWQTWMIGSMSLCYGVGAASISNFLPTLVKRLTVDTVKANLYTIAPNLNGAIWIVVMCYVSDRFQKRALCAIFAIAVSMIGFICLGTVDVIHHFELGYFFTFLITFGGFTPAVIIPAWATSNITSNNSRATTLGLLSGMQNIAGIISSVAFRTQDAPVYAPALITSGCFQAGFVIMATLAWIYYKRLNRQLDSGAKVGVVGMEHNPDFRYVL